VISRPPGGSHDWVRQTHRSFEIIVLDIPQMTSRPRGGSHDWVWQTPRSFEITILESIIKHRIQTEFLGKFKARDKRVCLCSTRGTHLSKVPSWAKHLAKDFTTQSDGAPAKTCPTSHKASLNQDKNTYTSGEHEQLIKLSSFSICSTVQTSQLI
jgi:hypothetical protein